ncbi:MFS transporter [Inquilinus limosus]|uniref:MFS transporter n=1 Tax=Inquilinus limosus TaxID=171674 RepID=UPI003F5CCF86
MPESRPQTIAKITWRLMPFLGLLYLIAYIDRQNVSYAKLQMVGDLGLSEAAYGLGASLFFIGYFIFEVPSNVILARVGARRWLARIIFSWGLVTVALAFTQNATMFYILRFLLGAAEAGFFPGVLFALTLWFPQMYRGRMVGLFMAWSALANAVGSTVGGALLDLDGMIGLKGWEWVFIATGIPAVLMGVVTYFFLPDRPETATFLDDGEKKWLRDVLARENAQGKMQHGSPFAALLDRRVQLLALFYIAFPLGAYGLSYWLPTVVKGFGVSNTVNGLLNVIPWACVALALWWVPRNAARTGDQTWHIVIPALIAAVCLALSVVVPGNAVKFALLCIAAVGIFAPQPVFWSLPPTFLTGATAAAGIAAINSVGNLGGFIAQNAVPWIGDATGSQLAPMWFLAACLVLGALMTFVVQAALRRQQPPTAGRMRSAPAE